MVEEVPSPTSPLPQVDGGQLCLIKPVNKKSKFWVHFSEYDPESHPDKKRYARCNLCGRDISVKQGTGGLKNHMKFKHPDENAELFNYVDTEDGENAAGEVDGGIPVASGGTPATPVTAAPPPKKKAKISAYAEITSRMDSEKRSKRKEDFDMWCKVRRELKDLKADLAVEEDEEAGKELERDIKNLKQMKAALDDQLGFSMTSEEAFV